MTAFPPLTHVALTVRDLSVSVPWYEALLDAEPVLDEDTEPDMHHTVYLLGNGTLLGLHQHEHRGTAEPFSEFRVGLDHVAFGCADRDELEKWAVPPRRARHRARRHQGRRLRLGRQLPRPRRHRARVLRPALVSDGATPAPTRSPRRGGRRVRAREPPTIGDPGDGHHPSMETSGEYLPVGVHAAEVRALSEQRGPMVSVYLNTPGDLEHAAQLADLHWNDLRRELTSRAADPRALEHVAPFVGPAHELGPALAAFATADGLLHVEHGPEPLPADVGRWDRLPVLGPLLRWRQDTVPYVVVLTDRRGADITAFGVGPGEEHAPRRPRRLRAHPQGQARRLEAAEDPAARRAHLGEPCPRGRRCRPERERRGRGAGDRGRR